jgi:hypothetical protein
VRILFDTILRIHDYLRSFHPGILRSVAEAPS